jgi:IS5 family transposase
MKGKTLFDEDDRLARLSKLGDPLEKLDEHINWELFRPLLAKAFKKYNKEEKKAGRPPLDFMMMFKVLILQAKENLSDDNTEYQINDRLSFQRFIGLRLKDRVPDAKSIWLYREHLKEKGTGDELFEMFEEQLEEAGIITREGSIVDATFVDAPRQRNSRAENKAIKEGKVPEGWGVEEGKEEKEMTKEEKGKKNRLEQKDLDARWTKKREEVHYGYKDHTKVDKDSKMIVKHIVTAASEHDSQELVNLMDEKDKEGWGDSGYVGVAILAALMLKVPGLKMHICEKGYKNKPLTEEQKAGNREKSRVRSRVEHVYGYMTNSMGGLIVRSIGLARAKCSTALKDLTYNMCRYAYLAGSGKCREVWGAAA